MKRLLLSASVLLLLLPSCQKTEETQTDTSPKEIAVTGITLSQPTAEMIVGETVQLQASVQPSNATDKTVLWASSKQSVATVTPQGLVTAVAVGTSTITASSGGKQATCIVTVEAATVAVESVDLDLYSATLEIGKEILLTATVNPSNATVKTVTWRSSAQAIASVTQDGTVKALKVGIANIIAEADGKSATCVITVAEHVIPVTSVTLDHPNIDMVKGQEVQLTATVGPEDATDRTVYWSSSAKDIADVTQGGLVSALKAGTAVITARAGEKSATCVVTITVPLESISLDRYNLTLEEGQQTTLIATLTPLDATDNEVTWTSSANDIASVDQNGTVTAHKEGFATITAGIGDITATCEVTVAKHVVPVTSVVLDRTQLDLIKGESAQLTATVSPGDATDKTVTWSSSDATVASVDQDGTVRGLKGGSATIIAKAGEKSATCAVSVTVPVSSVTLDRETAEIIAGESIKLTATVEPGDATNRTVTWTSSASSVASVAQDGTVTAHTAGTAVITAKAGEKSATCTVTVIADEFYPTPSSVSLPTEGGTFVVTVTAVRSYHLSSKPDWITEVSVSDKVHTFRADANDSESDRSGVIVFCDEKGTCQPCSVKQAGKDPERTGNNEDIPDGNPVNW